MLKANISSHVVERRKRLMSLDSEGVFIFFGANEVIRNFDSHFPFRQESNFYYLTEFDEPDAILVLSRGESTLFVLNRDPEMEVWNGERYGVERAKSIFAVDQVETVDEFASKIDELLKGARRVYFDLQEKSHRARNLVDVIHKASRRVGKGSHGTLPIFDPTPMVAKMRVIKDPVEVAQLRKACSITARAHEHLLKTIQPGMTEREACAEFQYFVLTHGCTDLGYNPIFASGTNATTLHYARNNEILKDGDLLLVDAAGECDWYTADLTQTFPIGLKFSDDQKRVYESVLAVNRAVTAMIKPGVVYRELHQKSCELLIEGLIDLGALKGTVQQNLDSKAYRKYYMHGLGHFLGLDVHDAGIYDHLGVDVPLEAGMVLTNEPGLYFRDFAAPFGGIGVRIEDDILVTPTGCEVLTHEVPRDVAAIEALR